MENTVERNATVAELVEYIRQGEQQQVISILLQQPNIKKQKNFHNVVRAAVDTKKEDILVWLVENAFDKNKNAALEMAVNSGIESIIELALNQGADVDEGIYYAVKTNNINTISALLSRGANINSDKKKGVTPLHAAVLQECEVNFVSFLIEKGADVNARNKDNKTALDLVKKSLANKANAATKEKLKELECLLKIHKLDDNMFECITGLPDGLHGYSYQVKLLTLYAIVNTKLANSTNSHYEIGTEVKGLIPFDDIYFKETKNGQTKYEFVQIKQTKKPEYNKINESKFFTLVKSDKHVKDSIKGNDTIFKMFIKADEIVSSHLKTGATGKFIFCENTTFEELPNNFCIRPDEKDLLCGVGGQKWKIPNWRYLEKEIKFVLFNIIKYSLYIKRMGSEYENNIKKQIEFINTITSDNSELWSVSQIAKEGEKLISEYSEYLKRSKAAIKTCQNIELTTDNVPEECELSHYTGDLSSLIKTALAKIKEISDSLENDTIIFKHFSKYKDSEMAKKMGYFVHHFCLYTACPTSDQLDDIITSEINEEFKFHKSRLMSCYCVQFFSTFISDFKNKRGVYFTDADGIKLFHDLRVQIFKGFSKSYTEDLLAYKIHFKENSKEVIDFVKNEKHKFLHVITDNPDLHALRVLQTLESIGKEETYFNYVDNVLFTSSEFIFKSEENVNHFFEAFSFIESNNLLVIAFPNYSTDNSDIVTVLEKLRKIRNTKKQIIVVAESDNRFATALKFMFKESISHRGSIRFEDLTDESQAHILNKTVHFQNNPISSEPNKKLTAFLTVPAAQEIIDEDVLATILINMENIQISNIEAFSSEEYNKAYYIHRRIQPQLFDGNILRYIHNNLFFVTGISKNELTAKVTGCENLIHYWQEGKFFDNGIILLPETDSHIENDEAFSKISDKCMKNIKWLEFKDEFIFWKGIKTNLPYADRVYMEVLEMDNVTSEKCSLLPQDLKKKIILLANNPGEGKSTMLTDLAYALKEKNPDVWVLRVDLKDYVDMQLPTSLNNINFNSEETMNAVKTISKMIINGDDSNMNVKLERKILEACLNGYGPTKVTLLFDGFDEVSPDYTEKTCVLIKALKKSNVQQMWVTTRVHMKVYLEEQLEEPAYVLAPFTEEQQVELLNRYWKWNLKNYTDDECQTEEQVSAQILNSLKACYNNYTKHTNNVEDLDNLMMIINADTDYTLKTLKETIDDRIDFSICARISLKEWMRTFRYEDEFSKAPLNLKLLAENIYNSKWNISSLRSIGTFEIFKRFVERKMKIYRENKSKIGSGNPAVRELADLASPVIDKLLRELAVKTLFPLSQFLPELNYSKECVNSNEITTRIGLVKSYGNRIEFVHRSYAEYFFSEYLSMHLEDPNVQFEVLADILVYDKYHLVRTFFDGFLSQNKSTKVSPKVMKQIMTMQNDRGESVLHLASCDGHENIHALILKNIESQNNAAELLLKLENENNVTDLESWKDNTDICDVIAEKVNQHPDLLKGLINIDSKGRMAVISSSMLGNEKARDIILKTALEHFDTVQYMLMKCNFKEETPLHVAAHNNKIQVGQLIMNMAMKYFDKYKDLIFTRDRNGHTALEVAVQGGKTEMCNVILNAVKKKEDDFKKLQMICRNDERIHNEISRFIRKNPDIFKEFPKKAEREVRRAAEPVTEAAKKELQMICRNDERIHNEISRFIRKNPDIFKEFPKKAEREVRRAAEPVTEAAKKELQMICRNDERMHNEISRFIRKNPDIFKEFPKKAEREVRRAAEPVTEAAKKVEQRIREDVKKVRISKGSVKKFLKKM